LFFHTNLTRAKKIISRREHPDNASLLEQTILQMSQLPNYAGNDVKLLEAQLVNYHNNDQNYTFLNFQTIPTFNELNLLFFSVLAIKEDDRASQVEKKYQKIPYLNSSLFELTDLEQKIKISNLDSTQNLNYYARTVLCDNNQRRLTGTSSILDYLFRFLDAYDFTSDAKLKTGNKTLINASVLGLIFEKINGYKDGSFYTPGFITEYMCRETIRRAVVAKINEAKGWQCEDFSGIKYEIDQKFAELKGVQNKESRDVFVDEINNVINRITICDPAVGSGHFLVSALNELIVIKHDLNILRHHDKSEIIDFSFSIENDNLVITDNDGDFFEYKVHNNNEALQKLQETLFHEKQTIIENCLFGVDINPNSVKICRLRLWIELLKNAYYTKDSSYNRLETLPNIDINIKCGNSLVSRFGLDMDIEKILFDINKDKIDSYIKVIENSYKKSGSAMSPLQKKEIKKQKIDEYLKNYKNAVVSYKNSSSDRASLNGIINGFKTKLQEQLIVNYGKDLSKLRSESANLLIKSESSLITKITNKEKKKILSDRKKVLLGIQKIESIYNDMQRSLYDNSFEWRFEFPEVLDNDGKFVGFDVVIGNPPYVYRNAEIENLKEYFNSHYYNTSGNYDLYKFFIELSIKITKQLGFNSLITNSSFLLQASYEKTRKFLLENSTLKNIVPLGGFVFDEATVDSVIYVLQNSKYFNERVSIINPNKPIEAVYTIEQNRFWNNEFLAFDYLLNDVEYAIANKILKNFPKIETCFDFGVGINTGYIKKELTSEVQLDNRYHPMVPGSGVFKYGNIITEGYIMYDKGFVKSKGKLGRTLPDEKYFTEPKILIVRTRNISLNERIIASIDYEKNITLIGFQT